VTLSKNAESTERKKPQAPKTQNSGHGPSRGKWMSSPMIPQGTCYLLPSMALTPEHHGQGQRRGCQQGWVKGTGLTTVGLQAALACPQVEPGQQLPAPTPALPDHQDAQSRGSPSHHHVQWHQVPLSHWRCAEEEVRKVKIYH
jgi:hypothetical protein